MPVSLKLDAIDLRIISDLQKDGRITNVALAKRAGISAPPCLRRVRTLEDAGYIRGYYAHVPPEMLGYTVTVFAQVGLTRQTDADLRAFEDLVHSWPRVRDCHMLAGDADFLLRIVAKDWDDYQQFLTKEMTAAPNVAHVKSYLTVKQSKLAPGVPLDQANDD